MKQTEILFEIAQALQENYVFNIVLGELML